MLKVRIYCENVFNSLFKTKKLRFSAAPNEGKQITEASKGIIINNFREKPRYSETFLIDVDESLPNTSNPTKLNGKIFDTLKKYKMEANHAAYKACRQCLFFPVYNLQKYCNNQFISRNSRNST